ncbi:MAG: IS1380 family transposase [Planctomycetota bacterium]|nr:IS1380 family transposase [Planctomycetota bacterium]
MSKSSRQRKRNPAGRMPEVREEFSGKVQTQYGGAGLWRRYLRKVGVVKRLSGVQVQWSGWRFRVVDYLHALLCGLILGLGRQCEVAGLRADPGALLALGLPAVPSQASLSRFLRRCTKRAGQQVLAVNRELLQAMRRGRVVATIDLDAEIVSTRGNPAGADFGYNPKRRGAKSYCVVLGSWGETRDVLDAQLHRGSQATLSGKLTRAAYRAARRSLPKGIRRLRLRADAGFFSHELLTALEKDRVVYCIAARTTPPMKRELPGLEYQALDAKWAICEYWYQGAAWEKPRRMIVVRERLEPENPRSEQLTLFHCDGFAYQVIATSATWPPEAVWHFYNNRSRLENIIKERQDDFAGDHILSRSAGGNATWLALSVLAYNLTNWFREKVLGQRRHRNTARTLRRQLIEIPATLVTRGRQYYLKLWSGHPSRRLFEGALAALEAFSL